MKFLIINSREQYANKLEILKNTCNNAGIVVDLWSSEDTSNVVEYAISNNYSALIHRNEHGRLFADGSLQWVKESVNKDLPVLSVDFGYFDHYKTFMFDFYRKHDLSSSIHEMWSDLPEKVNWSKAPKYIRKYRSKVFDKIAQADGSLYFGKVGVWMQWNTNLLRPELGNWPQWKWINNVCSNIRDLGLSPVVKMNIVNHSEIYQHTVPNIESWIPLVCDNANVSASNKCAYFDKEANWRMIAGCSYHVILCSSVSHLMVLTNRPVIATGQSWFNALNIFQEYVDWNSPLIKPKVNNNTRSKWINWWLDRQCLMDDSPAKLLQVYEAASAYFVKHIS
jgi:hypothetical protein